MSIIRAINWYALYVKSRHEFVAFNELKRKEIDTFLPSVKRLKQWKDRKKLVEFPLFPGYVFVCLNDNSGEFLSVLKTRGVVTFVSSAPGHPSTVPIEEINSLKLLLESGKELDVFPHLKEGSVVRVKRGLLRGAEGILARKDDEYVFLVNIFLLGRSVGVKIYADELEAA